MIHPVRSFSAGFCHRVRSTSECSSATAESPGPPWPAFRSRCPVHDMGTYRGADAMGMVGLSHVMP